MSDSPVIARVTALIAPILADLGLTLYDLEFGGGLLKLTVDQPGGVNLEALALVTRLVNRELDHEDPVPGKYTLEVSSPGIERSLRRPEHFTVVIGSTINVRLRDVTNESRRFQGVLVGADADGITVRVDDRPGAERTVAYHHIDRARTVFAWGPAPKGGRRPATPKSSPASSDAPTDASPDASTNQEVNAS